MKVTFDPGDVLRRMKQAKANTMEAISQEVNRHFADITATYDSPPTYRIEKHDDYYAAGTDNEKFALNNEGFTRYVTLSEDFQRKTIPGVIAAFPGAGRVVGFTPFGIDVPAGKWDEAVAEEMQPAAGPIARQEYGRLLTGR